MPVQRLRMGAIGVREKRTECGVLSIAATVSALWPEPAIEYAAEVGEEDPDKADDPNRWLWVDSEGSRPGYRDMEWFISDIDDPEVADRLSIAISGPGAFRRFRDTLSRWPDLFARWQAFSDDRQRGRARAWLADEGYAPSTPAPTDSST